MMQASTVKAVFTLLVLLACALQVIAQLTNVACTGQASCIDFETGACYVTSTGECTCEDDSCICAAGTSLDVTSTSSTYRTCIRSGLPCTSGGTECRDANAADNSGDPYVEECNAATLRCDCAPQYLVSGFACVSRPGRVCSSGGTQCSAEPILRNRGNPYVPACNTDTLRCDCALGYLLYWTEFWSDCVYRSGLSCTSGGTECSAANTEDTTGDPYEATCPSSTLRCACTAGYTVSQTSCIRAGLTCTGDAQCTTGNTNAAPENPYTTCDIATSRCYCAAGYYAFGTTCIRSGMNCSSVTVNTDCPSSNAKYTGVCTNARCNCAPGYSNIGGDCSRSGLPCTSGGTQCSDANTADATGDPYVATCNTATLRCDCAAGYSVSELACIPIQGLACTNGGTECREANIANTAEDPYDATCPATTLRCACAAGYTASGATCIRTGLACTGDAQCITGNTNAAPESPYTTCNITRSRCNCATAYYAFGTTCIRSGKPCSSLSQSTDCPASSVKYTGFCMDARCVCASGYTKVDGDCSGSTYLTGSLLMLSLTALIHTIV